MSITRYVGIVKKRICSNKRIHVDNHNDKMDSFFKKIKHIYCEGNDHNRGDLWFDNNYGIDH